MHLTTSVYVFLGLTALVAALVSVLVFAILRFAAAARDSDSRSPGFGSEATLLSAALQEAVTKLKAQERATAARAEASERLSGEIISSLTAGLLVVDLNGEIRILNPAGRRMLDLPDDASPAACRKALDELSLLRRDRTNALPAASPRAPLADAAGSAGTASRTSASPCRRCSTTAGRCMARSVCSRISLP